MQVAKFRQGSIFEDEKGLEYGDGGFSLLEGGSVELTDVIEWDRNGDLEWRSAAVRAVALAGESLTSPEMQSAQAAPETRFTSPVEHTQPKGNSTPLLAAWKTSVGYSLLGLFVGTPLIALVVDRISLVLVGAVSSAVNDGFGWALYLPFLMLISGAALVVYATVFYRSYFSTKPLSKSPELVSLLNCALGGPVFGLMWNRNLSKKEMKLTGSLVVGALMMAYFPLSLISYFVA